MQVTPELVLEIVNGHDGNQNVHIASILEIKRTSYSYTAAQTCHHITLFDADRTYLLLVSPLDVGDPQLKTPIPLPALSTLLSKILDNTKVPIPRPVAHDISGGDGKWPFGWLLLRVPGSSQTRSPMSLASIRDTLPPRQLARVELRLGTYLCALHEITNDWFGIPTDKPMPDTLSVPSFTTLMSVSETGEEGYGGGEEMAPYSWQDTFVLHLEDLLDTVCGDGRTSPSLDIDVGSLRLSLCRAIGSFLFDDVEMPRLIWVTGNEEDVVVSLIPREGRSITSEEDAEADIAYILPTFGRALWGDPLMEALFMPPGPSTAVNEGYFGGDADDALIVLPRHKTKRVWYTVYLSLLVLAEDVSRGEGEKVPNKETVRWARNILPECVEILKNAPCY